MQFQNKDISEVKQLQIGDKTINLELSITTEEKAQGLSGRKNLPADTGMLFVFEKEGNYHFWMKDMKFAIDMIWIGQNLRVTEIKKDAKPNSYPQVFGGQVKSLYVLEVPAGFSTENNIKVGDKVEFLR